MHFPRFSHFHFMPTWEYEYSNTIVVVERERETIRGDHRPLQICQQAQPGQKCQRDKRDKFYQRRSRRINHSHVVEMNTIFVVPFYLA